MNRTDLAEVIGSIAFLTLLSIGIVLMLAL
jgi:hypothetical protein